MSDNVENSTTGGSEAEEFVYLDPSQIIIGSNVRTDLPDAKEFRRSIKERGVLEAVTVYRDDEGRYVCLRGQRRTVEAAAVGTPSGTIPCLVVPEPGEADRIGDQMVENIHRVEMREAEIVAGVEQLALLGVGAAQIAKRTSLDRATVNTALAVSKGARARERVEAGDLTPGGSRDLRRVLENDPEAIERPECRKRWGHGLEHEAQRLRDEAVEREAYEAEVKRLRAEGLPVLSGEEADEARHALRVSRLRSPEGEPIPEEDWPTVPAAAVMPTEEWVYPEDEDGQGAATDAEAGADAQGEDAAADYEPKYGEPVKVYVPVWVVPTPRQPKWPATRSYL